jgi:hypothetical protein
MSLDILEEPPRVAWTWKSNSSEAILPVLDGLYGSEVQFVQTANEQCAGHIAEGYAKASGEVGLIMTTSGPGTTNLITPFQDALNDSVPLIAFTGQVPSRVSIPGGHQWAMEWSKTLLILKAWVAGRSINRRGWRERLKLNQLLHVLQNIFFWNRPLDFEIEYFSQHRCSRGYKPAGAIPFECENWVLRLRLSWIKVTSLSIFT